MKKKENFINKKLTNHLNKSNLCLCGNSYGKYGESDECNSPCSGNINEICGGLLSNSVYDSMPCMKRLKLRKNY